MKDKLLRQYHGDNHEVWWIMKTPEGLIYHIKRSDYTKNIYKDKYE